MMRSEARERSTVEAVEGQGAVYVRAEEQQHVGEEEDALLETRAGGTGTVTTVDGNVKHKGANYTNFKV